MLVWGRVSLCGYGSKLIHQGTAGCSPASIHQGKPFGVTLFLTHSPKSNSHRLKHPWGGASPVSTNKRCGLLWFHVRLGEVPLKGTILPVLAEGV